jgi:hypothetical protein
MFDAVGLGTFVACQICQREGFQTKHSPPHQ